MFNVICPLARSVLRPTPAALGTAAPGAWGIDQYATVLNLIRRDATLQALSAVVTPIQSLAGIAGNFDNNTSKTFLGVGFVPSERDRMEQWDEYRTESRGLKRSGLKDDDLSKGITGIGLVRMLGLCNRLHLDDCPPAPSPASPSSQIAREEDRLAPLANMADLVSRDKPDGGTATTADPTIDLLCVRRCAPGMARGPAADVDIQRSHQRTRRKRPGVSHPGERD